MLETQGEATARCYLTQGRQVLVRAVRNAGGYTLARSAGSAEKASPCQSENRLEPIICHHLHARERGSLLLPLSQARV